MREILRTSQFKRDVKLVQKRGQDTAALKAVLEVLIQAQALAPSFRDHPLKGLFKDCRECHIEPDWLLIYRIDGNVLQLIRTGSHADLFR